VGVVLSYLEGRRGDKIGMEGCQWEDAELFLLSCLQASSSHGDARLCRLETFASLRLAQQISHVKPARARQGLPGVRIFPFSNSYLIGILAAFILSNLFFGGAQISTPRRGTRTKRYSTAHRSDRTPRSATFANNEARHEGHAPPRFRGLASFNSRVPLHLKMSPLAKEPLTLT